MFETSKLTSCPAVPLKVRLTVWPGVVMVSLTGVPGVIVPLMFVTLNISTDIEPVLGAELEFPGYALITTVYVPAAGSAVVLRNMLEPQVSVDSKIEPSGLRTTTFGLQEDPLRLIFDTTRLTRWPTVPLKVRLIVCPGVVML